MAKKRGLKPGHTNNPHGRPPAGEAFVEQLRMAIYKAEFAHKKSLMAHAVERAYAEDTVLIALLKKLIPDLTESDFGQKTFEYFRAEVEKFKK